jgi:hypothetical protein
LIRSLLDMLRLRSGPQDLPPGAGLAVILSVAWLAQGLLTDRALDDADSAPRSLLAILHCSGRATARRGFRRPSARWPAPVSSSA